MARRTGGGGDGFAEMGTGGIGARRVMHAAAPALHGAGASDPERRPDDVRPTPLIISLSSQQLRMLPSMSALEDQTLLFGVRITSPDNVEPRGTTPHENQQGTRFLQISEFCAAPTLGGERPSSTRLKPSPEMSLPRSGPQETAFSQVCSFKPSQNINSTSNSKRNPCEAHHGIQDPVKSHRFRCEVCLQSFARKHDRRRHSLVHSPVKSFSCSICYKGFSRKDALKVSYLCLANKMPPNFRC